MKGEAVNEAARMIKFIMAFLRERPVVQAAGEQRRAAPQTAGQHIEGCSRPSIDLRPSFNSAPQRVDQLPRKRPDVHAGARAHTRSQTPN